MLQKLKRTIKDIVAFKPHAAADDKLSPPGNVYNSSPAQLIQRGKVGSTSEFSNILFSCAMPHQDSICGPLRLDGIYTRTTPVSDVDYDDLPIGSLCIMHTIASKAITDCQIYQQNIYGYGTLMTNNRDNIITATATAAQATAAGRWTGLRVRSIIGTGIDCSAVEQHGLYIETEVTGTGKSGSHYGLKIETYITASTTVGDEYGIGVFTYDDRTGSREIFGIRIEHNGASVPKALLCLQGSTWRWFLDTSTANGTWISKTTTLTCGTVGGWIKVRVATEDRYIQLYTSVS